MSRSSAFWANGVGSRMRGVGDHLAGLRRRVLEALGFALLAASGLLTLALLTYHRGDPSFDTAIDAAPRNFLGKSGAILSDLMLQSLGLAALLLPIVLTGWALRLLLARGLSGIVLRLLLLPLALLLASFAAALLGTVGFGEGYQPAGAGGAIGWVLQQAARSAGLADLAPTLAMVAAALVGLLLVLIMGLSRHDWRALGGGASRGAARLAGASGRSTRAAAGLGRQLFLQLRDIQDERIGRRAPAAATPPAPTRWPPGVTSLAERREPKLAGDPAAPRQAATPAPLLSPENEPETADSDGSTLPEPSAGRRSLVRLITPRAKTPNPGKRSEAERQTTLNLVPDEQPVLPPLDLLAKPKPSLVRQEIVNEEALEKNARLLETVLDDFGVRGEIVQVRPGPVVTLYELEPAPGIKASRIIGLADDIARSMSALSVRVAVVPGRTVMGIELPNHKAETVYLRELFDSPGYEKSSSRLALALGKDIGGEAVIADLAKMPHLLIAGTTGSGKSVGINTMILSILYRMPPDRCKFIMVDPKMLELSVYDGIPHLLAPVVTDPKKAVMALRWTVREMENRYRKMSKLGVRNIEGFNARVVEAREKGESLIRKVQTGFDPETGQPIFEEQPFDTSELPFIVVVVDEMADLMLVAGKEIEAAIQRLAQMARAAGIHIIMATQRPSVDVITGTIKANFPTRISFQVTSKIDSRTILGEGGAEQLLGRGDMLYMAGGGRITRVHAPFVSDDEVERVVSFLKSQGAPDYIDEVTEEDGSLDGGGETFGGGEDGDGSGDTLYDQAVALVCRERKASTSFVQRHLQIGYNRAARIIERMEQEGVVSGANHVGKREVLARHVE